MFRTEAERRAYYKGIRASIAWLHAEALNMNDPHARSILNNAGFHLGQAKPKPSESSVGQPSEASTAALATDDHPSTLPALPQTPLSDGGES